MGAAGRQMQQCPLPAPCRCAMRVCESWLLGTCACQLRTPRSNSTATLGGGAWALLAHRIQITSIGTLVCAQRRIDELPGICQLDVMIIWEVYNSMEAKILYPINYMRNYAYVQVRPPSRA